MLISVPPQTILVYSLMSKFLGYQVWGPQDDQLKQGFQLKSIYGQLIFLLNLKQIFW